MITTDGNAKGGEYFRGDILYNGGNALDIAGTRDGGIFISVGNSPEESTYHSYNFETKCWRTIINPEGHREMGDSRLTAATRNDLWHQGDGMLVKTLRF